MKKPSLLYASPFPPVKSGISEYSSVLVKELAENFKITLYTDDYKITDRTLSKFTVLRHGVDQIIYDRFQYILYNIGNQPFYHGYIYEAALQHPGHIILHDCSLYYLFIGYHQQKNNLYSSLYQYESVSTLKNILAYKKQEKIADLLQCEVLAAQYALNTELLLSGSKWIVHSMYAQNQIASSGLISNEDILKIGMIKQVEKESVLIPREQLFRKYHIPQDAFIVASFGIIAGTKLNLETIHAMQSLFQQTDMPLCYVMVGEGDYVDSELAEGRIIKTGYIPIDEFNSFLEYTDIVVNLRNPTRGETSAALLRALEKGKVCITNNGGWFSEIPSDCVCKINLQNTETELRNAIEALLNNPRERQAYSAAAKKYAAQESDPDIVRSKITAFITGSDSDKVASVRARPYG